MKKILVLTDFTPRSEAAAEFAIDLAIQTNSEVLLYNSFYYAPQPATVYAGLFDSKFRTYSAYEEESNRGLNALSSKLTKEKGLGEQDKMPEINCRSGMGSVAENVSEIFNKEDIWLIVMGNKRRGSLFTDALFGHETDEVLSVARCPVLLVPTKVDINAVKRIAIALDGGTNLDAKALQFLIEFSLPLNAQVFGVHVTVGSPAAERQSLASQLAEKEPEIEKHEVVFYDIQGQDVTKTILGFQPLVALDIIAVIHKKYSFFKRLFHHSVTKSLMNYHKVPLLVFPEHFVA